MDLNFDRQKLMDNINLLIQQSGMKIGDVESKVGISTGYISRLAKKETESAPGVDIIWKLAEVLNVSVDFLINGNFQHATDNLKYMSKFVKKLIRITDEVKLEWTPLPQAFFNSVLNGEEDFFLVLGRGEESDGRMDVSAVQGDEVLFNSKRRLVSLFLPDAPVRIAGTAFKTKINHGTELYMIPWKIDSGEDQERMYYELYFRKWVVGPEYEGGYGPPSDQDYVQTTIPVCSTLRGADEMRAELRELYRCLKMHEADLPIQEDARAEIEQFMGEGDGFMNISDEMPFN